MPDLNTQLQQYYGPKLQLPKQVTEGDYSFESAKGHSQGMTITLSCNNCKYIVTTEACLQKESGIWLKCTEPEFNHASKCITLIKCNEKIVNNVNSTKPSTGNTNSAQFTEHKRAGNLPHTTNIKAMNYGNYTNRLDSFKNPEWNSQSSSKAHSAVSLASNFHYRGKGDWISCSICHLDIKDWNGKNPLLIHQQITAIPCGDISPKPNYKSVSQWLSADNKIKCSDYFKSLNSDQKHKNLKMLTKWTIDSGKPFSLDYLLGFADTNEISSIATTESQQEVGAIMYAIKMMQSGCLKALLNSEKVDRQADLNKVYHNEDGDKLSPVELANQQERIDMVNLLTPCYEGENKPLKLHDAAINNDENQISQLVKEGFDINSQTASFKLTPLHLAAMNDAKAAYDALINLGANPSLKDSKGKTAEDWQSNKK